MASRSLRLTFVYTVIWTSVLTSLLFLGKTMLSKIDRANAANLLAADWGTLKGFLRIEQGKVMWYADFDDRGESAMVARLRRMVIVTDSRGKVIARPPAGTRPTDAELVDIARQASQVPVSRMARDGNGNPFLLVCGPLRDERGSQLYYGFIGRTLPMSRWFGYWLLLILPAAGLSFALSWLMVRQAQKIELPDAGIVS